MKNLISITFLILFILTSVSIYSEQTTRDIHSQNENYIKILSVEPLTHVKDGENAIFKVEIEYELYSYDKGQIMIGFNTYRYNSYRMNFNDAVIVERERNRFVLETRVIAKKWDDKGDFKIYVNLSHYPHEESWSPLVSDTAIIEVEASEPAKLSNAKIWAIALTGIMTEINNDSHYTLNSDILNDENKQDYINMLRRDWGIKSREELLITIDSIEQNGHASELKYIQNILDKLSRENLSIFNIYNNYKLSQKQYNYLKFTIANLSLFENRSILVWDLGRNIALCRWGYDSGYLTEDEAWEKIMYYAKKIQPLYSSWEDYGFDYYMGRVFWASGFGKDLEYLFQTEIIYKKLIGENGYWSSLDWNIDLNE